MKKYIIPAVALTLLGTSAALAQYNGNPSDRDRGVTQQQQYRDDNRSGNQNDRYQNQGRDGYQGRNEVRDRPHWSRGDRLPPEYRDQQYVVSDWRNNHLRRPPRGYHWVRTNDQYVLAAIASGVIADIIIDSQRGR
jgi:Ni/Co efflux regulator RcnB